MSDLDLSTFYETNDTFLIRNQVSISSTLNARFFRTNVILAAFFKLHVRSKSCQNDVHTFNVDEIDYRTQSFKTFRRLSQPG